MHGEIFVTIYNNTILQLIAHILLLCFVSYNDLICDNILKKKSAIKKNM